MSYFNMVEFLVKEVAKANEQIESLTRKAEDDKSVIDRLGKVHDKYFSEAKSAKADLEEMTIEKDHWKEEALEKRDYWYEEEAEQYKIEVEKLRSNLDTYKGRLSNLSDVITNSDAVYEDRIAKLQLEINHLKNNK